MSGNRPWRLMLRRWERRLRRGDKAINATACKLIIICDILKNNRVFKDFTQLHRRDLTIPARKSS